MRQPGLAEGSWPNCMTEIRLWEIVLVGTPAMFAAILSFASVLIANRTGDRLQKYQHTINSRMDQLLELTAASAHDKGMAEQRKVDGR